MITRIMRNGIPDLGKGLSPKLRLFPVQPWLGRQRISAGLSRKWSAIIPDLRLKSVAANVGAIQDSRFSFLRKDENYEKNE
jgi:hypothetical protein